jgi:hypothetical protein
MGNTQAPAQEPYEVIYEQAMRRIAALDETWQEAVRDVGSPAPAAVVTDAAPPAADVRPVAPALPPLPPRPRPAVVATAEITAITGPETAEAVSARAAAPRWRRSLAS